jgi:hypothetical protein
MTEGKFRYHSLYYHAFWCYLFTPSKLSVKEKKIMENELKEKLDSLNEILVRLRSHL